MNKSSWAVIALLYLNFIGVCTFTIACADYVPTVSYLASIRNHDILAVFTFCLFFFSLVPLFLSFNVKVARVLVKEELAILSLFELGIVVLGITCGLVDEINAVEFNPVDNLHVFLSFALSSLSIFWVYYALHFLERTFLVMEQKKMITFCWRLYKLLLLLYIVTLLQWHFAYTTYNGVLANTLIESICEWSLITLSIRFPVYFSEIIDYSISIYQEDKKSIN